jgi:membrane protease subunit HflC
MSNAANSSKLVPTLLITIIAAIVLAYTSLVVVREGEIKVILQFGQAVRLYDQPGLKFKIPFLENVTVYPKYQMVYNSEPTPILTRDKKPIIVDNYTVWRIDNPELFLRSVQSVKAGEERIDAAVYNTVRRKLSEVNYDAVISENTARGNLNDDITKEVADLLVRDNYGIKIIDVRIKRTDLPEENKNSVYNRMISNRQSIAALYLSEGDEESRKITSFADRQARELVAEAESKAKKIIAEGEQEAGKIYNDAYGKDAEFYRLYRTLDSYVTSFNGETVIMMPINSPYAQILLGQ